MNVAVIMCIVLAIWLFFALIAIIIVGQDDGFEKEEWLATFLLIFVPPIWGIIKLCYIIKSKKNNKRKKHKSTL